MLQLNYSNGVQEALTPVVNANGNATGVLAPPAGEDYLVKGSLHTVTYNGQTTCTWRAGSM